MRIAYTDGYGEPSIRVIRAPGGDNREAPPAPAVPESPPNPLPQPPRSIREAVGSVGIAPATRPQNPAVIPVAAVGAANPGRSESYADSKTFRKTTAASRTTPVTQ